MTPSPSTPMTGVEASRSMDGSSTSPGKPLGAFDAPRPAVKSAAPATEHVSIKSDGTTSKAAAQVPLPTVPMEQPKTLVQAKKAGGQTAVITYVEDGDTASAKNKDGSTINCRIDGIDAPETAKPKLGKAGQAYGDQAKAELQRLIDQKEVTVRITKPTDKYNRSVCPIEIEGKDVSQEMARAGAAWVYERFVSDAGLLGAQSEARTAKRGLWANKDAIPPNRFRSAQEFGFQR